MWSQFPTWLLFACILLGSGCVATVLFIARDTERRLRGIGEDADRKLEGHDEAFGQLEGRVEDLAARLASSTSERRDLSRSNQRLSAELENWAGELKATRGNLAAQEGEVARLRDQNREASEQTRAHRSKLDESQAAIGALQAELAGKARQLEILDRQRAELEELHRREVADLAQRARHHGEQQIQLSAQVAELEAALAARDRALESSAAEAKALAQSREEIAERAELQAEENRALHRREVDHARELAQRDRAFAEHAPRIESLEADLAASRREVEAARERCAELESRLAAQAQAQLEGERDAREHERAQAVRLAEVEADLARHETSLREQAAAHESSLRDHVAVHEALLRERTAAHEAALHEQASAYESTLREHATGHETALREHAAARESLAAELAMRERDLVAARERCQELERHVELEQERARGAREAEGVLSLRVTELAGELARREDDLRERAAAVARLEEELVTRGHEVEAVVERCRELGHEVRRLEDEQAEKERNLADAEAAREEERTGLETALKTHETELLALRTERASLAERCDALAHEVETGRQELRECEQRLIETEERLQLARLEVQRGLEAAALERAPIDPLVEGRILPCVKRADALPEGYVGALEQGDLELAMRNLLGGSEPLTAEAMAALAGRWRQAWTAWRSAPIVDPVVYLWADGVHVKAGLGGEGQALLVVLAAFVDGTRAVVAVESGKRESKEDWLLVLRNLERRGMSLPRLVVADETLGLGEALDELGWTCARQRCWSRRTDEVLALIPKERQSRFADKLRKILNAETRADAKDLRDEFVKRCGARLAAAGEKLCADWRQMTSHFAFPKAHWAHLRTANVVEASLAALRLRVGEPKPSIATPDAEAMLWKLLSIAESTQRKINSPLLLPAVARGDAFVDGEADDRSRNRAA